MAIQLDICLLGGGASPGEGTPRGWVPLWNSQDKCDGIL